MRKHIENLIQYEIEHGVISKRDYTYVRNQLFDLLKVDLDDTTTAFESIQNPAEALNPILDNLIEHGFLKDSVVERDLFDAKIMNIFASLPSTVESKYYDLHKTSKKSATDFLYDYAKSLNYIRYDRILKNKSFDYETDLIKLGITINLSKPEKDPKDIIAASKVLDSNYPKCVLCKENEGFAGNQKRDSRDQHRLIGLELAGKPWYFQYSPYIYYNEHAIVFSGEHVPMKISKNTFNNLLNLVDKFDGYFFGSNADLPIVGGSILSHDHYQGGRHHFPIEDANILKYWNLDDVTIYALDWPLSTIRLQGKDKTSLVELADQVLSIWKNYSNEPLDILSHTGETPHNTITPVVRFKNGNYELDLILRNNRTTTNLPSGIFHPHPDKHHIKKENIGLIEAIGLAILPARLIDEIKALKAYHFENKELTGNAIVHKAWFDEIAKNNQLTNENFDRVVEFEIGQVFENVLKDCGVFKRETKHEFVKFIKENIYERLSK